MGGDTTIDSVLSNLPKYIICQCSSFKSNEEGSTSNLTDMNTALLNMVLEILHLKRFTMKILREPTKVDEDLVQGKKANPFIVFYLETDDDSCFPFLEGSHPFPR